MNGMERISLIQERLREIQRRWSDLKAEVAYIERKRRRAKRKEREGKCLTCFYILMFIVFFLFLS